MKHGVIKTFFLLLAVLAMVMSMSAGFAETATFMNKVTVDVTAEEIDMKHIRVTDMDGFIKFLQKFPNLKKVDMFASVMTPKRIDALVEAFPDVEFGWTMRLGEHDVRTDATAFSTLHSNQSDPHNEKQFKYLKYCKNLVALDIGHNLVTDLSFLYDLPNLKVLILACNINLTDITPVGSLVNLEYLELFKNHIRDISPLANCKKLLDLNVCFNNIQDYTPLEELENLERLWIYNSNNWKESDTVKREVVTALQEALPNCYVDSTSYSTTGGWREHDRYYVIYHTFKYGEYIPFENADEILHLYKD